MDELPDFDDFCSGDFFFFIPSRDVWPDFTDFIDDDTKGALDLFESQC